MVGTPAEFPQLHVTALASVILGRFFPDKKIKQLPLTCTWPTRTTLSSQVSWVHFCSSLSLFSACCSLSVCWPLPPGAELAKDFSFAMGEKSVQPMQKMLPDIARMRLNPWAGRLAPIARHTVPTKWCILHQHSSSCTMSMRLRRVVWS